jgi:hypothetical protein
MIPGCDCGGADQRAASSLISRLISVQMSFTRSRRQFSSW